MSLEGQLGDLDLRDIFQTVTLPRDRLVGESRGLEAFKVAGTALSWMLLARPFPRAASGGL